FTVNVATTAPQGTDPSFKPAFKNYNVIVSNYNGDDWPKETQDAFVDYVKSGGGFACIHAADNAFPNWPEYNEMIGLGGWGGRTEKSGPYVYPNEAAQALRDVSKAPGGPPAPQPPFKTPARDAAPPTPRGMPRQWLHVNDELYDKLRGPGQNMHI